MCRNLEPKSLPNYIYHRHVLPPPYEQELGTFHCYIREHAHITQSILKGGLSNDEVYICITKKCISQKLPKNLKPFFWAEGCILNYNKVGGGQKSLKIGY